MRSSLSAINSAFSSAPSKRPKLTPADRLLWAWLCAVWNDWQSGVFIVKAATVIGCHRKGFRLFWAWKVRHDKPGRPAVSKEVRTLIGTMSCENPLWGAPRIHGELLKLGIDIGETSVSKYLVRRHKPSSQTWRTFLDNHVKTSGSFFQGGGVRRAAGLMPEAGKATSARTAFAEVYRRARESVACEWAGRPS